MDGDTLDDAERKAAYREKLAGIGFGLRFKDTSRTWVVKRDDNGKTAGTQTEHWDGRIDATVRPPRPHVGISEVAQ